MSGFNTQRPQLKRTIGQNVTSVIKKIVLEELCDNSDILNSWTQYSGHIQSILDAQDQVRAQVAMLRYQQSLKPAEDPLVLEIVRPDDQQEDGTDRRKIKVRKASKPKTPAANTNKTPTPEDGKVLRDKTDRKTTLDNQATQTDSVDGPTRMVKENMQTSHGNVEVQQAMNSNEYQGENVYIPIFMEPSEPGGASDGYDLSTMIEIQDEDQNQIILPPELQQPILQLLSTRGANLRKITFTHNDVVQTIEIVPADANSSGDEGTHLILTPHGLSQDVTDDNNTLQSEITS